MIPEVEADSEEETNLNESTESGVWTGAKIAKGKKKQTNENISQHFSSFHLFLAFIPGQNKRDLPSTDEEQTNEEGLSNFFIFNYESFTLSRRSFSIILHSHFRWRWRRARATNITRRRGQIQAPTEKEGCTVFLLASERRETMLHVSPRFQNQRIPQRTYQKPSSG